MQPGQSNRTVVDVSRSICVALVFIGILGNIAKHRGIGVVHSVESLVKRELKMARIERMKLTALFISSNPGHMTQASAICRSSVLLRSGLKGS